MDFPAAPLIATTFGFQRRKETLFEAVYLLVCIAGEFQGI
jgi:hypothetical protein